MSVLDQFISKALSEVKARKQAKAKGKPLPKAQGETEFALAKKRLALFSETQRVNKWKYTEVTLFVRRSTCRCCGEKITCWPDGVLITMENKLLGKHQRNISEDYTPDMYPGVPRNIHYYDVEVPTCLECFQTEIKSNGHGDQLDLFPETLHSYSQAEPFAGNKNMINQLRSEITELESKHAKH